MASAAINKSSGEAERSYQRQPDVDNRTFDLSPVVIKYIKEIANFIDNMDEKSRAAELDKFFRNVQKDSNHIPFQPGHDTLQSLRSYFSSVHADVLAPPSDNDLSFPLPSYYISSSHNTYLSGNQLYGDASVDAYTDVLLRDCRCVEIDVWNGRDADDTDQYASLEQHVVESMRSRFHLNREDPERHNISHAVTRSLEPRVLHGHTLTKEVSFREVCEAIRKTAFRTSQLPVIVSLEVHANFQQQQMMIDIMHEEWDGLIVIPPDSPVVQLPSPADLLGKILIKVKYTAPRAVKERKAEGDSVLKSNTTAQGTASDSSSDEESVDTQKKKQKKPKLLSALSALGVYLQGYHFKGFDRPEAKVPNHVFSLSEGAVLEHQEKDFTTLFAHNQKFLMRAFPKSLRVTSTNLDPARQWRAGVQMAALNWQTDDRSMMLNEGMFAGTGGWQLKPPSYRPRSGLPQKSIKQLTLSIELLAAQSLPMPRGTFSYKFHPHLSCTLHIDSPISAPVPSQTKQSRLDRLLSRTRSPDAEDPTETKRHSQVHAGPDPDFLRETIRFSSVPMMEESLSFLRFKISDRVEMRDDPLAGWACLRLDRVREGFRMIRFFDAQSRRSDGVLFVRIAKTVVDGTGTGY